MAAVTGSGSFGGSIVAAPSSPEPITLLMPINGPELPVTLTSRISAFLMFANEMPLAQLPVTLTSDEAIQRLVGMDAGGVGQDAGNPSRERSRT